MWVSEKPQACSREPFFYHTGCSAVMLAGREEADFSGILACDVRLPMSFSMSVETSGASTDREKSRSGVPALRTHRGRARPPGVRLYTSAAKTDGAARRSLPFCAQKRTAQRAVPTILRFMR